MIAGCGWLVLLTLAMLLWHLLSQTLPLAGNPKVLHQQTLKIPADQTVLSIGEMEQGMALMTRAQDCSIEFLLRDASDSILHSVKRIPGLCSDQLNLLRYGSDNYIARLSASGIVRIEQIVQVKQQISTEPVVTLAVSDGSNKTAPLLGWNLKFSEEQIFVAMQYSDSWQVFLIDRSDPAKISQHKIITQSELILLPGQMSVVFSDGSTLFHHNLNHDSINVSQLGERIKEIFPLPGQRSMLVNLSDGSVQKWSLVNRRGALVFEYIYTLNIPLKVVSVDAHSNENAGILITQDQKLVLVNLVTGEWTNSHPVELAYTHTLWEGNTFIGSSQNSVDVWSVTNLSGVNTLTALWQKIQYEGYSEPEYVWQTTYATDHREAKYSLVPLLIGSLKASFLALLIAIPLAVFSAIYTAFFAPAKLRNWMKPSIEMLEAIPSVVLGFIAAIWLVPLAEQFLISVLLFVLLIPFVLVLFALIHQPLVDILPQPFKQGWELPVVAVLIVLLGYLVFFVSDNAFSASSLQHNSGFLQTYIISHVNKSTLVVAIALGIAIAPSIYSLAEDAIYEVPASLQQASLALGATRLQTLRKVVLVLAYPGILSAIALGLGRAFGETMIVLMVTGNTPIADWDLLSGIRALTANLAIELPEAEFGSSHYQILLVSALLLFVFTFVINTLAEILRQWVRKKYQHA